VSTLTAIVKVFRDVLERGEKHLRSNKTLITQYTVNKSHLTGLTS